MTDIPEVYDSGRYRTRNSGRVTFPISLGTTYKDTKFPPYGDGPWGYPQNWVYDPGLGEVDSQQEICIDELHAGPPYRSGGPFNNWTFWTDQWQAGAGTVAYYFISKYEGEHVIAHLPSAYLDYISLEHFAQNEGTTDQLHASGVTGWNRFRPTRPSASTGVALGEIHEVPRMLRTTAKSFARIYRAAYGRKAPRNMSRALANDWLNIQFGWIPFLSDLREFYKTCKNLDTKLKQLRRDNGRWIRRGGTVAVDDSEPVAAYSQSGSLGLRPALATGFYNAPYGESDVHTVYTGIHWFEGAFRYWIPPEKETWKWNAKATAGLFGLRPSPSLIWELTPWSWLVDWVCNIGASLASLDSIMYDNLCAKYAYVMGTRRQTATSTGTNNYKSGPVTLTRSAYLESKARREASPFGFGLTSDTFTGRQWSILGALGLTRLR
mgnify:FL=1